jgi:hypothetical protein
MSITAPPRNTPISSIQGQGQIEQRESADASGEPSGGPSIRLLVDALALAARHSAASSIHFVFMDWGHLREILAAGDEVYGELKDLIVWVKSEAGQGLLYRSQHELLLVFENSAGAHQNTFDLGQHRQTRSNVWSHADVVALIADAMRDCSRRSDIVLDPFIGSGTTILAAERSGRRCYGVDLDPLNVDAAVRRWQVLTRRDAVLAGTTTTFDEVTAARSTTKHGGRK